MPDWRHDVRARLSSLRLSATREAEIVDELSQHLDDRYRELEQAGRRRRRPRCWRWPSSGRTTCWRDTWRHCGRRRRPRPSRWEHRADG